jgi:hypothetical protein
LFCPQIFNLLCVRDGIRHPPAVDAIGAIEEPGRGQFKAEALKLGDEGVNVEFRHGDEGTSAQPESEGEGLSTQPHHAWPGVVALSQACPWNTSAPALSRESLAMR